VKFKYYFLFIIIIVTNIVFILNYDKAVESYDVASVKCKSLIKEEKIDYKNKDELVLTCIKNIVRSSLDKNEIKEAARELTLLAANDNIFYGYCHLAMHLLGTELLNYYKTIDNAIKNVNFIDCGNGLSHGVLDQWATKKISNQEFKSAILSCEEIEVISPGGCAEGIGHASFQSRADLVFDERIENALEKCNYFILPNGGWHCAYGAMMQPFFKQNPDLISEKQLKIPESEKLIMLCEKNAKKIEYVYNGCISGAGWLMGLKETIRTLEISDKERIERYIESEDFYDILKNNIIACKIIKNISASDNCSLQMFSRLPLSWYIGEINFLKRCERLVDLYMIRNCIAGGYEFIPPVEFKKIISENDKKYNIKILISDRWSRERSDKIPLD
jgi:hypothetical protein